MFNTFLNLPTALRHGSIFNFTFNSFDVSGKINPLVAGISFFSTICIISAFDGSEGKPPYDEVGQVNEEQG